MSIGQKQIWAKVLDFTVQDYVTRSILFQVKYAQNVSIGQEYQKLEVRGGSDNEVQGTIYHSPVASFKASLPMIDDNVLIVKTGATRKTGAQMNSFEKIYTVDASAGTVTLGATPTTGTLKIYNIDSDENLGTEIIAGTPTSNVEEYSITGAVVTFNDAKKALKVLTVFDYTTGSTATGLVLVSGKLPSLVRITAKTKSEDKAGNKVIKTIIVEKAKSDPTFNLETAAGSNTVVPFECEVFGWVNEDGETQFHRLVTDDKLEV
jgi:hypothetical protein